MSVFNLLYWVKILFLTYTVLLFLRILSSWFPAWRGHKFVRFLSFYTDPYLNFFKKILPPLGGVLDLSPVLAFFALQFLEKIVIGLIR